MGRTRRLDWPGAWHHVMDRASGKRLAFRNDADRYAFVALLGQLDERFGVEVHCYCLMGNHFHVLVRSAEGRLSEAMQWLLAGYTRAANAHRGVDGAIFRGRFHSVLADQPAHRYVLVPYVLANPIDLPWTQPLHTYPWSSLGALVAPDRHLGVNRWLHDDAVRQMYDMDDLLAAVESRRRSPTAPLEWEAVASLRQSAGDLDWSDVLLAVETGRFVSGERVGDGSAKAAAVLIAIDVLGWPRERVRRCAEVSASGLRSTIARGRSRMKSEPSFAQVLRFAVGMLSGVPVAV